jgi:hypothetical protein
MPKTGASLIQTRFFLAYQPESGTDPVGITLSKLSNGGRRHIGLLSYHRFRMGALLLPDSGHGCIAAYVWDYAGEYEFARRFSDAALRIDPRASAFDPGRKATIGGELGLRDAFVTAGCTRVETCVFDDFGEFPSREAY